MGTLSKVFRELSVSDTWPLSEPDPKVNGELSGYGVPNKEKNHEGNDKNTRPVKAVFILAAAVVIISDFWKSCCGSFEQDVRSAPASIYLMLSDCCGRHMPSSEETYFKRFGRIFCSICLDPEAAFGRDGSSLWSG